MATIVKLPSGRYVNMDNLICTDDEACLVAHCVDGQDYNWDGDDAAAIIAALDAEDAKRRAAADPLPTFSAPAPDMSHDLRIGAPWRSAPPEEGPKVTCAEEHTPIVCPSCGKECVVIITANGAPVCYKCGYNTEGGE